MLTRLKIQDAIFCFLNKLNNTTGIGKHDTALVFSSLIDWYLLFKLGYS